MYKPCQNKVTMRYVRDYEYQEVELPCGSIGSVGIPIYCDDCEAELHHLYPQGWDYVPGDLCEHGTYVGDAYGRDYLCHACEMGDE